MNFPPCRWAGGPRGAGRECRSPKVLAPRGVPSEVCAACPYRDHAGIAPPAAAPAATPRGMCLSLGDALTLHELTVRGLDASPQTPCGAKLRRCSEHGLCTSSIPRPGVACCVGCKDYDSGAV